MKNRNQARQNGSALLAVGILGLILGCSSGETGPKLVPVEGVVTYQGKPLAEAQVSFKPQAGPVATALTDAEGKFLLSTRGTPGTVVGSHQVAISAYEQSASSQGGSEDNSAVAPPASRIPEKYGLPQRSGLTAVVQEKAEENQFRFELQ